MLTTNLDEVETALVETSNKGDGGEAQTLADLRGLVLVWHPIEQFLTLTGRTYFKGMSFGDVRRFQFDLETTGLDEDRDRIFMISMRDSTGWQACLDTGSLSEAGLIEQFVEVIRARDPRTCSKTTISLRSTCPSWSNAPPGSACRWRSGATALSPGWRRTFLTAANGPSHFCVGESQDERSSIRSTPYAGSVPAHLTCDATG